MVELTRGQLVAWGVAAILLAAAAVKLLGPGDPPSAPIVRAEPRPRAAGVERGGVFVHVAGAVRRPGLLRLPAGARIAEAVTRAGGVTRRADLTAVNLAARVQDGQQIVVPVAGRAPAGPAGLAARGAGSGAAGAKLSLATATVEQLDALDGIGPTLAKRIVEYRDAHGGFRSIDELREVEGIGEKRFAALREAVAP